MRAALFLLALILLAIPPRAHAAEPLALGVQTHFAFDSGGTDAAVFRSWMARSGFGSSRDEMFWWDVEDASGALALRKGAQRTRDAWASMAAPFAALLTVDFSHPSHDGGAQPRTDTGRAAFARYAGYVAGRSRPQVRWVEVWNEWNTPTADERRAGSRGDAREYAMLAGATSRAIKAAHPGIAVLAGSAADDTGWRWIRQAIGAGLLSHADGLAVHLYNHCQAAPFVGADEMARRLDTLHALVSADAQRPLPIYVTEVGWPTHRGDCGVAEQAAAAHSLRFLLEASVRPWIAGVWFYELQDGGDDPANREHHFGLLRRDGSEKPAGCVLRELGARVAARPFAVSDGGTYSAAGFRNGGTDRWLLWPRATATAPVAVRIAAAPGRASAITSPALCGLARGELRLDARAATATVRLPAGGVQVLDVPAGEVLAMEEAR